MQKTDFTNNMEEWIKVESKRHPNKFYYFNKKTGQSKWVSDGEEKTLGEKSASSKESPQGTKSIPKATKRGGISKKTPAQDRLKLLQNTLGEKNRVELKDKSNMRLGLEQVLAEAKAQTNVLTKNNRITENKVIKASKQSVQDRLKIKPPEVIDDDVLMKEQMTQASPDIGNDDDETEFMDWEPIPEEIVLYEITTIRKDKNTTTELSEESIEKIKLQSLKTHGNNFYIVLDTNIFISNLKFLENLNNHIFPQLQYTYLVVPYVVLQELDKLKHRRNDRISVIATHAIHFLNRSFTTESSRLCGQSAVKSAEHLIEIENPDDKIINCCLQIASNDNNWVILLSNDINLRNKAIFNQIKAYSKADLDNNKISLATELSKLN